VDFDLGAYMSAKFLLSRGHKRIAMLMTFDGFQPGEERKRGYYRALAEAGIAPDPSLIRAIPYGASQVSHGTYHLLQHLEATAFIDCSGAESAAGLRDGARRAGRVFGEDVEAVVWTYTNTAPVLEEAAAHIWLPSREAATEGLELLADWIHGRRNGPIHVVYPPTMFHTGAERNTANHAAAQPDTASSVFSRAG
jgi:LacI family transcriptional regulator